MNRAGRRFVNKSTSHHEFVLAMYRSQEQVPTFPAFLVCDSDFMERWGLGLAAGNDVRSVMGGQYPAPGITLGPALTFGWLAGRHAAAHAAVPQPDLETSS